MTPGDRPESAEVRAELTEGPQGCRAMTVCLPTSQGAAAHPDSEEQQQRLREAAEGLRMATNVAAQNAIKKKLVQRLEVRLRDKPGARACGCCGGLKLEGLVGEGPLLFPWRMAWAGSARDWVWECPGLVLTTLSPQHAAKQAAASATQTIAAAQHAASTPKVSAGPQPLLVQSCKVRLREVCGRRCGGGGTFPQPARGSDSHDVFLCRLWQSRFHCWCRASEGAKLSPTVPVPS